MVRIQHFLKVYGFAKTIGELENLDNDSRFILETAAIVHDIGIKPALEKYGSSAGKYQEELGGSPARDILGELGFDESLTALFFSWNITTPTRVLTVWTGKCSLKPIFS